MYPWHLPAYLCTDLIPLDFLVGHLVPPCPGIHSAYPTTQSAHLVFFLYNLLYTFSVADPGFPRGGGANSPGGRQHTTCPIFPKTA